jgi:hypothetical protein
MEEKNCVIVTVAVNENYFLKVDYGIWSSIQANNLI